MRGGDSIVGAAHDRAGHAVDEAFERRDELLEAAVVVEVVGLDARHDRGLGTESQERAVALVGFDDEPLAAAVRRVGADLVDLAADHEAGLPARARRMSASIDDVVVLPCEPATAIVRRVAASAASAAERCSTGDTELARRDQLDVSLGDRGRVHDRVGVGRHVLGAVADDDAHAGRLEAREHDRVLDVGAAHLVAHAHEQQRDRAHADATHTDDVQAARAGEVERRNRDSVTGTRVLLDEIRDRGRGIGPAELPRRRAHPIEAIRLGQQLRHDRVEARRIAILVEHDDRRARPFERLRVADLVIARRSRQRHEHRRHAGHRELGDGAGARATHRERRPREQRLHVRLVGHQLVGQRVTFPSLRIERRRAFDLVAGPADVANRHVGAVAPAVVAADRGAVDRTGALRAAEDREERRIPRRFPHDGRDRRPDRIPGQRRVAERRSRQRHRRRAPSRTPIRLARPGTASWSCTIVGTRNTRAATTHGSDA